MKDISNNLLRLRLSLIDIKEYIQNSRIMIVKYINIPIFNPNIVNESRIWRNWSFSKCTRIKIIMDKIIEENIRLSAIYPLYSSLISSKLFIISKIGIIQKNMIKTESKVDIFLILIYQSFFLKQN